MFWQKKGLLLGQISLQELLTSIRSKTKRDTSSDYFALAETSVNSFLQDREFKKTFLKLFYKKGVIVLKKPVTCPCHPYYLVLVKKYPRFALSCFHNGKKVTPSYAEYSDLALLFGPQLEQLLKKETALHFLQSIEKNHPI